MPEITIKNGEEKNDWKKKNGRHTGARNDLAPALPGCSQHFGKPAGITTPEDAPCALWFLRLGILPLRRQSMPPD